jgi:hypothetical protein
MNASNTIVMIDEPTTHVIYPKGRATTMHRALLVSELIGIIFQYLGELDLRSLSPNPKRSWAACARTCRAWHEPALNLIWESLDSLLPLLKLFPREAFAESSRKIPALWVRAL